MVKDDINSIKNILLLLLDFAIPVAIIQIQGDTGTVLVFTFIFICMCFCAGVSFKYFLSALAAVVIAFPILWTEFLKPYQKMRILTSFNPELDPTNWGYQAVQSKMAIGSGGVWGAGLFKGTLTQYELLPAKHTDCIFAVIGEEAGLIGCSLVVLLLTAIIIRCIIVSIHAHDSFGSFICVGVAAMVIFQVFENIGMCLGMLPVIGITLPFLSYGGSSIVSIFCGMGLVMAVHYRRKEIHFGE